MPLVLPQKRVLDDDHSPAVSSPLNPDVKPMQRVQVQAPNEEGQVAISREKRAKKDSLKKRESKGAAAIVPDINSRSTPDRKVQRDAGPGEIAPLRYKLAPPKPSDFEQSRGPVFTNPHQVQSPDGRTVEFLETSEQ